MAATVIDSLRGILNGFRTLNSKGIYTMNATETDLLRQILLEVQALSLGGLVDGSVTTAKLADNAVTTAKILDNNVTAAKILNANVTPAKLSQPLTVGSPASPAAVSVVDYVIPSWASIVICSLSGISLSGSENLNFRLGSSGVPKATGYLGASTNLENGILIVGSNISATFPILISNATNLLHGSITFTLIDLATNTWAASGIFSTSAFNVSFLVSGSVSLDATLDIVRIFAPTNTFDAGKLNVSYL